MNHVIWLSASDCEPPHGLDMTYDSRDYRKVKWLYEMFVEDGFDLSKSALVGYPLNGRVQLLSGTHRHRAAQHSGIKLPVTLWLRSYVEAYWGLPEWTEMTADIPVRDLIDYPESNGDRDAPALGDMIQWPH